jgi:hypothetical protein
MKRLLTTVVVVISSILLNGCDRDEFDELVTSAITVKAKYPATYSQEFANGATITLTSVTDNSVKTATTNANGDAIFSDVLPGEYSISASRILTAAEALPLTGISSATTLNAILNSATVISSQNPTFELKLQGSAVGGFVIKEVYYTGSKTASGGNYFSDQFIEIYNNSTDTLYLDSLYIADISGASGLINPTTLPTPFNTDSENSYANSVWQIPGTGKQHPLAPGRSIIIAQDGVNHKDATLNPESPVDLSNADWETFNERPDNRDADAPNVPNLERVYFTGGFDWLITVFGPAVVIFKGDFTKLEQVPIPGANPVIAPRIKIPNNIVIDGAEFLRDGTSASFKRLPAAVDAGFSFADGTYTKQSLRRKTSTTINGRRVLQDTNNSTADFELITTPTPRSFN